MATTRLLLLTALVTLFMMAMPKVEGFMGGEAEHHRREQFPEYIHEDEAMYPPGHGHHEQGMPDMSGEHPVDEYIADELPPEL